MRLTIFGEGIFSEKVIKSLIDNGHTILLLITPVRGNDNNYKRLQVLAELQGFSFIHVKDINSNEIRNKLIEIKSDLILSIHLKKILKKEIFSMSKLGAINVHPSLLPKYRGLSPINQALIHGDSNTAVTLHYIDEGIDTGDIIVQKIVPIKKTDTFYDLLIKIISIYQYIFNDAIELIKNPNFRATKQTKFNSSYFGKISKKDREIELNSSKEQVYNLVRGLSAPSEGAYYEDRIIWSIEYLERNREKELMETYNEMGMYCFDEDDFILFRLKNGLLISNDFEIDKNI